MKYDFNNPEHFKALEKQAFDGTIEVADFPPAAYRYFDSLRLLCMKFKYDGLSRVEAAEKKKHLLARYREAASAYDNMLAVYSTHQDNIRKAGTLLAEIEKAATAADIALKACECIGLMTGDDGFFKRQAEKIM